MRVQPYEADAVAGATTHFVGTRASRDEHRGQSETGSVGMALVEADRTNSSGLSQGSGGGHRATYPESGASGAAPGGEALQGSGGRVARRVQEALVFSLLYVWLWQEVELHLIFHGAGSITNFPSFYATWRFFLEHTAYPGGLTEYLSAFLSQLFYYSWLGAAVVTFQAWGFRLCIAYLLDAAGLGVWRALGYVPAMLLLVVYGKYTYHFPTTLALLIALCLACAVVAVVQRWPRRTAHIIVFGVVSLACYGLLGGAFLAFALICVIREGLFVKDWRCALSYAVSATAIPYLVGVLGFGVSRVDAYTQLLPFSWRVLYYETRSRYVTMIYVLYGLVPAVWVAGGVGRLVWGWFRHRAAKGPTGARQERDSGRAPGRSRPCCRGSPEKERPDGLSRPWLWLGLRQL